MVAENGLGAELVSGCGVVSAWTEGLHPCFVWVLNMLDCIILGSMDIGQELAKQGFPLNLCRAHVSYGPAIRGRRE